MLFSFIFIGFYMERNIQFNVTPLFKFNPNTFSNININPDPDITKIILGGIAILAVSVTGIILGYLAFKSNNFSYSNNTIIIDENYCNLIVELILHYQGFYNGPSLEFTQKTIISLFKELNRLGFTELNSHELDYIFKEVKNKTQFIDLISKVVV